MNNSMSMVMLDNTKGWIDEWINEWINYWINCILCINKWKIWFINEWRSVNEWMNAWMYEWINELINDNLLISVRRASVNIFGMTQHVLELSQS